MTAVPANPRWLSGRLPDLLFGCGLVYLVPFALLAIDGSGLRTVFPPAVTPFLVLLTGAPHYGATLLRVFERRADRRRYWTFAMSVSVALAIAFVIGLQNVALGSFLITLYLTWSPWHYSGQNYGIALMFLRRRNVAVAPLAKRLLHASFLLSFLLTLVMSHAVDPDTTYAPNQYEDTVYRFVALGLPTVVTDVLIPVLGIGWVVSVLGSLHLLRRSSPLRDLLPSIALIASQSLWFVVPTLARRYDVLQGIEPLGTDQATYTFLWIAATHSVQYLWITHYYARRNGERSGFGWAGKAWASGAAIWIVPALLFAPGVFGSLPHDAGLALMVAAVVNIHHFILDGVIWKLRDGPVARVLLNTAPDDAPSATAAASSRTMPRLIYGTGAVCVLIWIMAISLRAFELEPALRSGDVAAIQAAHRHLSWIGHETPRAWFALAGLHQQRGEDAAAREATAEALRLQPGADGLFQLSTLHHQARRGDEAIAAIERALELRPDSRRIQHRLAWLLVSYRSGDNDAVRRALAITQQLVTGTAQKSAIYLHTHAMALAAAGDLPAAIAATRRGIEVAEELGQGQLVELLRSYLERYQQAR